MTPIRNITKAVLLIFGLLLGFIPALCSDEGGTPATPGSISVDDVDRVARLERFVMFPPPSLRVDAALSTESEVALMPIAPSAAVLVMPVRVNDEKRSSFTKAKFLSLTTLAHAGAAFDSWSTNRLIDRGGDEANPLVKPVAGTGAIYPIMQLWPAAMDYMALKMAHSDKPWLRKMWWLPQTLSAAASFTNGVRNVALANSLPPR